MFSEFGPQFFGGASPGRFRQGSPSPQQFGRRVGAGGFGGGPDLFACDVCGAPEAFDTGIGFQPLGLGMMPFPSFGLPGLAGPPTTAMGQQAGVGDVGAEGRVIPLWVDVFEAPDHYRLVADVPGIRKENVKLDLQRNNILRIQADRMYPRPDQEHQPVACEREYGRYRRHLRLPRDADRDNMQAKCLDGQLVITIPRKSAEHIEEQRVEQQVPLREREKEEQVQQQQPRHVREREQEPQQQQQQQQQQQPVDLTGTGTTAAGAGTAIQVPQVGRPSAISTPQAQADVPTAATTQAQGTQQGQAPSLLPQLEKLKEWQKQQELPGDRDKEKLRQLEEETPSFLGQKPAETKFGYDKEMMRDEYPEKEKEQRYKKDQLKDLQRDKEPILQQQPEQYQRGYGYPQEQEKEKDKGFISTPHLQQQEKEKLHGQFEEPSRVTPSAVGTGTSFTGQQKPQEYEKEMMRGVTQHPEKEKEKEQLYKKDKEPLLREREKNIPSSVSTTQQQQYQPQRAPQYEGIGGRDKEDILRGLPIAQGQPQAQEQVKEKEQIPSFISDRDKEKGMLDKDNIFTQPTPQVHKEKPEDQQQYRPTSTTDESQYQPPSYARPGLGLGTQQQEEMMMQPQQQQQRDKDQSLLGTGTGVPQLPQQQKWEQPAVSTPTPTQTTQTQQQGLGVEPQLGVGYQQEEQRGDSMSSMLGRQIQPSRVGDLSQGMKQRDTSAASSIPSSVPSSDQEQLPQQQQPGLTRRRSWDIPVQLGSYRHSV